MLYFKIQNSSSKNKPFQGEKIQVGKTNCTNLQFYKTSSPFSNSKKELTDPQFISMSRHNISKSRTVPAK
jgi:hypothetical protein